MKKKGDEMEWNDFDEPDEPDECAGIVMATLSERGLEMLERFYDEGQTPSQICIKMGLTAGQFRAVKSRAWAHWRGLKNAANGLQGWTDTGFLISGGDVTHASWN